MSFQMKYQIHSRYLTKPSQRRHGFPMSPGVTFIVAHDTGNPGSTASGSVAWYGNTRNEHSAASHLFVDDRQILECIPALTASPPEKVWHVRYPLPIGDQRFGHDANDAAIGVEYCFGGRIDPVNQEKNNGTVSSQ